MTLSAQIASRSKSVIALRLCRTTAELVIVAGALCMELIVRSRTISGKVNRYPEVGTDRPVHHDRGDREQMESIKCRMAGLRARRAAAEGSTVLRSMSA